MRAWGVVALLAVAAIAAAGVAAEQIGPAVPAEVPAGTAVSSVWACPHGGGSGWEGTVALANPGVAPVEARITALSGGPAGPSETVTVPAGGQVLHPVSARHLESATIVEAFGGWLAVGWLVRAAEPDRGVTAEPCAPQTGTTWLTTETSTEDGEDAFLIVANPFTAGAVFDVVLYSPDNPPLRDPDWSDIVLRGGRSMALPISRKVVGETAVAAVLQAKVGRVAVGTLAVSAGGGVRGTLGTPVPGTTWYLPTKAGAGQASLITFVPDDRGVSFGADLLSTREPQVVGDLVDAQQGGASTQVAPVITRGPSMIVVTSTDEGTFVGALRADGQSGDDAATGGTVTPGPTWVILPTVVDEPSFPGIVVANPGTDAVTVTLRRLPTADGAPADEVSFQIGSSKVSSAPEGFLEADPRAAVMVSASGPVVAAGVSTSAGVRGLSLYAIAVGTAVPDGVVAAR
jgi:hypothetical protein